MTQLSRERCEFDGCTRRAEMLVHAQWSIADFVAYSMCFEHRNEAAVILQNRWVDGEPPFDVWFTYFGTEESL